MKLFYLLLILIINIYLVNAEISIYKETYSPKEIFQAELYFENLIEDISPNNIKILNQNNELTNIGVLLTRITKERYFIYFDVPEIEEGNYILSLNNIKYIENGILKKENFQKKFIIKKEINDLISIKPAFTTFNKEQKNFFKIDVKNKGDNIINIKIIDDSNSTNIFNNNLTIAKNSEDSFYFSVLESLIKDRDKLNLKLEYNEKLLILPVFLLLNEEKFSFYMEKNEMKNYISSYSLEIPFGNYVETNIFLENNLNKNLSNLTIRLSEELNEIIKLGFYTIENLGNNKTLKLPLFINQDRNIKKGEYSGNLIIKNSEIENSLPIMIKIIENELYKEDEVKPVEKELEKEIEYQKENKTIIKEKKSLSKKTVSYISILSVIAFFLLIFFILYIKTGKKNKYRK